MPGSALIVLIPAGETQLASIKELSLGILSATQGAYATAQMLLDIGQGARIAASAYRRSHAPVLSLEQSGAGARVVGWQAAVRRAEAAPQLLRPGLLASQIPSGAGYVGTTAANAIDGALAADRAGRVSASSLGSPQTLLARIATLRAVGKSLLVADLPAGAQGLGELRALAHSRAANELLLVVQRVADRPGHELLWVAAAGLAGGGGRELTSNTTNQRGLIASVDLASTILERIGRPIPADMRGEAIRTDGALDSRGLRSFEARLHVIGGRRLKALGCLLGAWALLLLAVSLPARKRAGGARAGRARARRAWAMRVGGLALLWTPVAVLLGAALEPSAGVEYLVITLAALLLGALADALLPWPRAPLAPALVTILALVADALLGTQLLVRSLLGPNPILGARFYGFGNELKSGLAVLALAAVAAALYPAVSGRRAAVAVAGTGALLAAIEGAARLGAGVGGVILVSAGFAVATIMLLPGALTRRRALLVLAAPLLALIALALLDLATAHGSGHFTGSILHARSPGDLRDVIVRRYTAAWNELKNHAMPAATAVALVYAAVGLHRRRCLLAIVEHDPAWPAAMAGGLTAGVIGALSEDSGPVLLVVAVFALGCLSSYLWGAPSPSAHTRDTPLAARSRALRPASAPPR